MIDKCVCVCVCVFVCVYVRSTAPRQHPRTMPLNFQVSCSVLAHQGSSMTSRIIWPISKWFVRAALWNHNNEIELHLIIDNGLSADLSLLPYPTKVHFMEPPSYSTAKEAKISQFKKVILQQSQWQTLRFKLNISSVMSSTSFAT